jgi:hypothetical protein
MLAKKKKLPVIFSLIAITGMYVGRKIGWAMSRAFLYSSKTGTTVIGCIVWGVLIAALIRGLIVWQQPHWILKYILGFALGAYVAVPNYGLVAEPTIPPHAIKRHELISLLPLWIYILASVAFAFLL